MPRTIKVIPTEKEAARLLRLAESFGASAERVVDSGYWPTITFTPPQLIAMLEAAQRGGRS